MTILEIELLSPLLRMGAIVFPCPLGVAIHDGALQSASHWSEQSRSDLHNDGDHSGHVSHRSKRVLARSPASDSLELGHESITRGRAIPPIRRDAGSDPLPRTRLLYSAGGSACGSASPMLRVRYTFPLSMSVRPAVVQSLRTARTVTGRGVMGFWPVSPPDSDRPGLKAC